MFKDHDPIAVIGSAMRSVAGWAVVIGATLLAGLWLGIFIVTGTALSLQEVVMLAVTCTFAWLVFPQIGLAFAATLLAWCLPLKIDSGRIRLGAAVGNFLAWLGIAAWVVSSQW